MSKINRPVTSREYKLMLSVDRFKSRDEGSQAFWTLVEFLVIKSGGNILKRPSGDMVERLKKEEKRKTSYIDTTGLSLRQSGFILRLREETGGDKKFQINLKCRAADRYIAAAKDISTTLAAAKRKFEEDILPPFSSKFSTSMTVKADSLPDFTRMGHLAALFPGLGQLGIPADLPVEIVNGFIANEVVRKVGTFQFGGEPEIKASLSFWYLLGDNDEWPLVAEFSFDYDMPEPPPEGTHELEEYPDTVVEASNRLFVALQNQAGWVNLNATTKTAFALESL